MKGQAYKYRICPITHLFTEMLNSEEFGFSTEHIGQRSILVIRVNTRGLTWHYMELTSRVLNVVMNVDFKWSSVRRIEAWSWSMSSTKNVSARFVPHGRFVPLDSFQGCTSVFGFWFFWFRFFMLTWKTYFQKKVWFFMFLKNCPSMWNYFLIFYVFTRRATTTVVDFLIGLEPILSTNQK